MGRASLTWRQNGDHTIETGFEAAFNFREANLAIANDTGSGPVRAVLPVADTRVEELRGEAFVTDVWKMTPALRLESGFTFEASRITQTGDAQQEREFTYPKPRAILTWQIDPSNQLRVQTTSMSPTTARPISPTASSCSRSPRKASSRRLPTRSSGAHPQSSATTTKRSTGRPAAGPPPNGSCRSLSPRGFSGNDWKKVGRLRTKSALSGTCAGYLISLAVLAD